MTYKLGSLFDGSGGFPLAGSLCGIVPVWAAEVEPYPIAVTRSRFPNMRHLGDISKVNGAEIEPVDIITFGSPCQDLSVAGKRAGLKHADNGDEETTRSGLFMEAVRIIKEMREATNGIYPKFALWENVPGAFSSNKGEDFKIVCEELIKIIEPAAVMPAVPKNGWPYADSYCGDGWSLAYRVFDAQYWGVPQRRRRIHLIVDFTGQCARNVLFEREGVRGYFEAGRTPWQRIAANVKNCARAADRELESSRAIKQVAGFKAGNGAKANGIGYEEGIAPTLSAAPSGTNQAPAVVYRKGTRPHSKEEAQTWEAAEIANTINTFDVGEARANELVVEPRVYESRPMDSRIKELGGAAPTVSVKWHKGAADTPLVVEAGPAYSIQGNTIDRNAQQNGSGICEGVSHTINSVDRHGVCYSIQGNMIGRADKNGPQGDGINENTCFTLNTIDRQAVAQPIVFDKEVYNSGAGSTGGHYISCGGPAPTLRTKEPAGICVRYTVRRLTPTECARLQGFADNWGHIEKKESMAPEEYTFWLEVRNTHAAINGKAVKEYTEKQMLTWYNKLHTDSAEYKMWGNGIALPPALYCMQGIADALEARNT